MGIGLKQFFVMSNSLPPNQPTRCMSRIGVSIYYYKVTNACTHCLPCLPCLSDRAIPHHAMSCHATPFGWDAIHAGVFFFVTVAVQCCRPRPSSCPPYVLGGVSVLWEMGAPPLGETKRYLLICLSMCLSICLLFVCSVPVCSNYRTTLPPFKPKITPFIHSPRTPHTMVLFTTVALECRWRCYASPPLDLV